MIVTKRLIRIIGLFFVILQISVMAVFAQEPDQEVTPILVAPEGQLDLTFEQLGFEADVLEQDGAGTSFDINLPGNFQILSTDSYLELLTSHLPPRPEKTSLLQTKVNGQLLSNLVLTDTNAISNVLRLDLEDGLLQTGRNNIAVNLATNTSCEDPATFLKVTVHDDSHLSFAYQQLPYPTDLGLYPFPFSEQSLLKIPVTIVLPDQPTSGDLSVAATIAAGLGQATRGNIDLTAVEVGNLTPEIQNNNHLIVIGKPEANPLIDSLDLLFPIDETILKPGQGIVQELVSPWNEFRVVLVVSGLDGEGLIMASEGLNRQAHFLGMRGPVAIVVDLAPLADENDLSAPSFTLASLNYDDQVAYGTLPVSYRYDFRLPLGWQLEEPPYFVLKFSHADILSVDSALDIKLNNLPIGSTLLDDSNADEGELVVSLPSRRLRAGQNRLEVSVEMSLPNITDACGGVGNQRAWTVISNESEIFLPYQELNLPPDLNLFPHPFSQISGFDQTAIIVPDQPAPQTYSQLMRLAVRLGSLSGVPKISARVRFASEINSEISQNHHLILLGRPTQNLLLAELNDYLPQPFVSGSDLLEPLAVDEVAFLPDPERDAGLLELIESPWNNQLNILSITGTTDPGVDLATQTLLQQGGRLEGNLAVVEPSFNPSSAESFQVRTYSVDTRRIIQARQEQSSTTNESVSESDLSALANRWWR